MSTDIKVNYADTARSLYPGYRGERPVGDVIRTLVRKGRSVVKSQSMRWEENRNFYAGNQWVKPNIGASALNQLNRTVSVPSGRPGYNAYNRLRAMTDARVALLTKERPPYEIDPEDNDQDSLEAAKMAEKFVSARWGRNGWNIKQRSAELAKNGDIDGISWLCVEWDPNAAISVDQPLAVRADGQPVIDRNEYEALKAQDPEMQTLWRIIRSKRPIGDVSWRVVLPAALSVDPFAVRSFDDAMWIAETRIRPRAEIERRMGKSFKDLVKESAEALAERGASPQYEDLAIGEGGNRDFISEADGVVVHYFYAKPSADFPKGARVEILDRAPAKPIFASEWEDELPYFAYIPRPDPGHFIRSRGVVDDLKPIQRDYNQTLRDLRMWLFKVAHAPVHIPIGALRSNAYYNEDGYVEVHAAAGQPQQASVPAEPTAVLTNNLVWMASEMERVSGVSALAQGFNSPGGPEAAVGISQQIQQTEHNLSETEVNMTDAIEWGVGRSLKLVERHYDMARTVTGVGVDDAQEFKAFTGQMLRGAHRFRVTGPLMPKSKAARMAQINALAPMIGERLLPYVGQFIDGDTDAFMRDIDQSQKHQRAEIRDLLTLVTNPQALAVYENFEADKQAFSQAFNAAAQTASQMGADPMTGQPMDPMQLLGQRGITPPNLTRSMQEAGLELPLVEPEDDDNLVELAACNTFRLSDAYKKTHPMFKQLLREHMADHKGGARAQMQAMAMQSPVGQQSGSAAAEKGTPSPPKQPAAQQGGM